MSSRKFFETNTQIFSKFSKEVQENKVASSGSQWFKVVARDKPYTLRFQPPWSDEGSPFLTSYNHNFLRHIDQEGKEFGVSPVCLTALFSNNHKHLLRYAVAAKKVTKDDHTLFLEKGCPICRIAKAIKPTDQRLSNEITVKPKYISGVLNLETGALNYWSMPNPVFEMVTQKIEMCLLEGVNLIDPYKGTNLLLKVTGERLQRKYAVDFTRSVSEFNYDGELLDLAKAFVSGVRGYNDLCDVVSNTPHVNKHKIECGMEF